MYSHQVRQKSLNSWLRPLLSTIQSFISLWMKDFGGHSYELSSVTTGREWLRMKQQIITLSSQRQETLGEKIIWLLQPQQRYELTLVVIIDYEVRTWYRLKVFFGFRSNAGFTRIRNEWLGTHYAVWGKLVKTRGKRLQSSWKAIWKILFSKETDDVRSWTDRTLLILQRRTFNGCCIPFNWNEVFV